MTSRTAEQEEARNRHPDNPAQLLEKVRDKDVYRTTDLTYRVYVGARNDSTRTVDCTDAIERLAQPSFRAGRWTPPLVRLGGSASHRRARRSRASDDSMNSLVELTAAGEEVLAKALKRRVQKTTSRQVLAAKPRQSATPVFQAA